MSTIEKLDLKSPDLVNENFEKLATLFPNCITESAEGKAIDFDLLKQELSHQVVAGNKERYRIEWPGKREAVVTANLPTTKTLRPVKKESVDFENSEHLYFEGDNLEVLKLLQESYLGKIKMIYIDPPYNTGKDFVYKDNFSKGIKDELEADGQKDEYNQRLVGNPETAGRYHSDWLSMMYPRLKLGRNLLTEDGLIFISIDEHEVSNLKKVVEEIFGENNLLSCFVWKSDGNFDNQARVKKAHEYILAFAKNENEVGLPPVIDPSIPETSKLFQEKIVNTIIKNGPKNPPSDLLLPIGFPSNCDSQVVGKDKVVWPQYDKDLIINEGKLVKEVKAYSGWSSKALIEKFIKNGFNPVKDSKGQDTTFYVTDNGAIEAEKKRSGNQSYVQSIISSVGTTQSTSANLKKEGIYFSFPKPVDLIKYLLQMNEGSDFTFLDFFAGSSSSAEAVLKLNKEDGGKRRFIQVQIPEEIYKEDNAYKAGFKNICEIGKERIRRVGDKIKEESNSETDCGFRVYRLDESNMQDVYYKPQEFKQDALDPFSDNVKPDRTEDDLLAQVMLDWGLPLSLKIEKLNINGLNVFKVAGNSLMACFHKVDAGSKVGIDEAFAKEIAKEKPLRIVFRDNGFKDDTAKVNVKQLLKQLSPETEMKVI